jgi:hypothetical protein
LEDAFTEVDEHQPGRERAVAVRRSDGGRKPGFNADRAFQFHPFTPTLPTQLGAFHSFAG